ncbi:MAG: response regulator transcription factor [Deltaproteobacteria bacterium]|nr:response regulator transcription factor [Deltaproteobacteria bacterium]
MSGNADILIIEDESTIADFLRIGLSYEGYKVVIAKDGKTALDYIKEKEFDLIILDIMLPDIDGFELCQKFRNRNLSIPIIMLTAKKEVSDRVKGLDIGADDYITKPFSFEELLARIRAQLRRSGRKVENTKLYAGDIVLDLETREVTKAGELIYLTPTEFSLLELFMKHPRRVFTRETLINRVLGYNYIGETNVIDVHVSHLRDKIGDRPPHLIRTHYGVGYAFYPEC